MKFITISPYNQYFKQNTRNEKSAKNNNKKEKYTVQHTDLSQSFNRIFKRTTHNERDGRYKGDSRVKSIVKVGYTRETWISSKRLVA